METKNKLRTRVTPYGLAGGLLLTAATGECTNWGATVRSTQESVDAHGVAQNVSLLKTLVNITNGTGRTLSKTTAGIGDFIMLAWSSIAGQMFLATAEGPNTPLELDSAVYRQADVVPGNSIPAAGHVYNGLSQANTLPDAVGTGHDGAASALGVGGATYNAFANAMVGAGGIINAAAPAAIDSYRNTITTWIETNAAALAAPAIELASLPAGLRPGGISTQGGEDLFRLFLGYALLSACSTSHVAFAGVQPPHLQNVAGPGMRLRDLRALVTLLGTL